MLGGQRAAHCSLCIDILVCIIVQNPGSHTGKAVPISLFLVVSLVEYLVESLLILFMFLSKDLISDLELVASSVT